MLAEVRRTLIRKVAVRMGVVLTVIVMLWLAAIGTVWLVSLWENREPPRTDTDAIIVLGAQVLPSGQPNRILKTRLEMAAEAYRAAPRPIVCCGAQGNDEPAPEGLVMRNYLIGLGLPEADIQAETASYNTYENLDNAKALLPPSARSVLIVTSDYHVARALWIAQDKGLTAYGAGSPTYWKWRFKNHTKEALSWIKYLYMKVTGSV